jgi:hypothetical protein
MSMFYPDRWDTMLFTWGLAMSWGGLYLATPEGVSLSAEEGKLRDFERRHADLLRGQRKMSRLAFYDSRRNRELYGQAEARSLYAMKTWMQICYRGNVPFDLIQQEELERLGEYAVVVLNEVAILTEAELVALQSFAANGGTLVWTGRTGSLDENGATRDPGQLARRWALGDLDGTKDGGEPRSHAVGSGRLVLVPGDLGLGPYELPHNADRWQEEPVRVPLQSIDAAERRVWNEIRVMLADLLPGGPDMQASDLPEDVVVTYFRAGKADSLLVHVVNAAGTLAAPEGDDVGHEDVIPYPDHARMTPAKLKLRRPADLAGRRPVGARYLDPEREDEVPTPVLSDEEWVTLQLNLGLIRGYGLIEIPMV